MLDSDLTFALQRVSEAIAVHAPLSLQDGPRPRAALGVHARHLRSGGGAIDLRHTLLACT